MTKPPSTLLPVATSRATQRRRLAVIIGLGLGSLALVRVGSMVWERRQDEAEARRQVEALNSLVAALNQLEKYAGPDQRANTPTEFGDTNRASVGAQSSGGGSGASADSADAPRTRSWSSTFGNPDFVPPAGNPGGTVKPSQKLLDWLATGNKPDMPVQATTGH